MKNLILVLTFIFSFNLFAQVTPDHLVIWGSIPPAIAKPGDSIHFLAIAPGNNLEYRFYSVKDGEPQQLIQDWGPSHSFNAVLPLDFFSINYYAQVRAIGDTRVVEVWQSYIFGQDLVLQSTELFPSEILKINHRYFEAGEHYNVTFATASGYSRIVDGIVNINGRLDVVVPEYIDPTTGQNVEGLVTVSVEGVKTPARKLLKIKQSASLPVADFSINLNNGGVVPFQANLNASLSYSPGHENEPDRGITSCVWQLTRGNTGDKKITVPGCLYTPFITETGNYTISLTITDINGGIASITKSFQALEGGVNQSPIANFFYIENPPNSKIVQFDSGPSFDLDGSIVSTVWSFSDGGISTEANPIHSFQSDGTFMVTLTVFDNQGASNSITKPVTLTHINGLVANFNFLQVMGSVLQVDFDASLSFDTSGTIIEYHWDFGGGQLGTGKNVSHIYDSAGNYNVTLTVINDHGDTMSITKAVEVIENNLAPIASFSFTQTSQGPTYGVDFDASSSVDYDGSISSYRFDFGDGNISASEINPIFTHEYGMRTTLMVTLTVTDNKGKTGTTSKMITIIGLNQAPIANFSWDTPVNTSEAMFLDATSSYDPDGDIVWYRWAIDGETVSQTGSQVRLENKITGPRTITLTVIDNDGKEENLSHVIIVEPKSINGANLDFINGDLADWFTTGVVETIKRCELFALQEMKNLNVINRRSLQYVWKKPRNKCEDNIFAAVVTSSGVNETAGLLTQFIDGDGTYTKLKGKIIFLTNEDISPVINDDRFKIKIRSLGNDQIITNTIFDQGISDITWTSTGAIGFRFSSSPVPFEISINLQSMDFRVEDVGDSLVDSAMAIYDLELSNE